MKKILIILFVVAAIFMGAKNVVEKTAAPVLGEIYPDPLTAN